MLLMPLRGLNSNYLQFLLSVSPMTLIQTYTLLYLAHSKSFHSYQLTAGRRGSINQNTLLQPDISPQTTTQRNSYHIYSDKYKENHCSKDSKSKYGNSPKWPSTKQLKGQLFLLPAQLKIHLKQKSIHSLYVEIQLTFQSKL